MEIDIKKKTENELAFVVEGANVAFINALRRICTVEVPTLAIETVDIYRNDSRFFDEVLAQRLGLVPLKTDLGLFTLASECECEDHCPSCSVSLTLKEKGPKVVHSGDLNSENANVEPVYDSIPLLRLEENQEVELEAAAQLGLGLEHAKWQPTTACAYKYYPLVIIDESCEVCMKCVEECPRGILKLEEEGKKVIAVNMDECSMCKSCVKACESDAVRVESQANKFLFRIETDGSLSPEEVLENACNILSEKSEKVITFLK